MPSWAAVTPESEQNAGAIMARVAANQDAAQRLRAAYIYRQQMVVRFRDGGGKLVREEASEYSITPTPDGSNKELAAFSGKYLSKKREFVSYNESGKEAPDRHVDIDADFIHDLRDEMVNDDKTRDGLGAELFPLTTREQQKYEFRLQGEETFRGLPVYRLSFQPKRGSKGTDFDTKNGPWAGEVLVSRDDGQPVLVTTRLARKVPAVVRAFLGTNLHGLGFSVRYEKFDDGVWFPVSFGSEFRVRALFFYKRSITVSMENSGFRRADVSSRIAFEDVP